jgi:hypothetical protein
MSCRSVVRMIAALGVVWAVQGAWLPASEAGGRLEPPKVFVQKENGSFFAGVWSSLTRLWDKNGCSIDPNGCSPLPLPPVKSPDLPRDTAPKEPIPPDTKG